MSEHSRLTRAAGIVGTATLLSRILGYLRDMVLAGLFGAGPLTDAFITAFRIPNLLRRLFGEGSLSIAFIPVFTDALTHKGPDDALRLAGSAFRLLMIVLAVAVLLGLAFAPWITRTIAYGFDPEADKFELCLKLTRLMFPYVFFIGLTALSMGVLNAMDHFTAPALAPTLLNLSMIACVAVTAWWSPDPVHRIYGLGIGVLIGGVMQFSFQLPFLARKGMTFRRSSGLFHPDIKKIVGMLLPATFGAAVFQINTLVGNLLASFQGHGGISYLYYADRLVQFPLGIFGISTATAALPSLARLAANNDMQSFRETVAYSINLGLLIMVPAMAGLIVLREPIIALLFQRGAFDPQATRMTATALLWYAVGLWAFSTVRVLVAGFYALQDTRTPVACAVVSIGANLVLGILLMQPMGHGGVALALSLSSMLNVVLLGIALRGRLGYLGGRKIVASACKIGVSSAIMALVVAGVSRWMMAAQDRATLDLTVGVLTSILIGLMVYTGCAAFFKVPELGRVIAFFKRKPERR
jgi:putative peptidoglycan lipid II flippase